MFHFTGKILQWRILVILAVSIGPTLVPTTPRTATFVGDNSEPSNWAVPDSIFNNNGTFNTGANTDWVAFSSGTGRQFNNRRLLNAEGPGVFGIFIPFIQSSARSGYDQLEVGTPVTLGGALTVTEILTPAIGDAFTTISNDGSDSIVGTFTGLLQVETIIILSSLPVCLLLTCLSKV